MKRKMDEHPTTSSLVRQGSMPHGTEGLFRFLNEDLERIEGISGSETGNVLRTETSFYDWEGEDVGL
jgi:hypothetical protein